MKAAYYETRRKTKHSTYKVCFNPMHGSEVIICMNMEGFSAKTAVSGN